MAVKLRLRREGTKRKSHFRVVAADHRAPRDGRFIEIIGEYHPMEDPSVVEIDSDRALHWLRSGAQPTEAVKNLLWLTGIWQEFKPEDEPSRQRVKDAIERAQSSEAVTADPEAEPEAAADEEPEAAAEGEPEAAAEGEPEAAAEDEPGAAAEDEPEAAADEEPGAAADEEPGAAAEDEPEAPVDEEPEADVTESADTETDEETEA